MSYKLGSLFDGSGGFPLAGSLCGIEPIWASEVEPYPIAVTKSRFKNMKHLGDISKINGAEIEPVDIITFGSPCQDLSVAGKRAGLKHEANGDEETTRSGLFMEAVRIIKEMRKATDGRYPTFAIWENVPGAFSSNKGEDFRIVLEELIKVAEPSAVMPEVPPKGWSYSDCYIGDGWSIAYRVLDAQYWGVPQRRRRIYLVADFRGECAKEILFEREGLRGYFTQGRTPWQNPSSYAERSLGADDREGETTALSMNWQAAVGAGLCVEEEITSPLSCTRVPAVSIPYTLKIRSGCEGGGKGALVQTDKSATLATNNDQYLFQPIGTAPYNGDLTGDKSSTLGVNCGMSTGRNGVIAIDKESFCSGEGFNRKPGITVGGPCATLQTNGVHAVCYPIENHPADSRVNLDESGKVQTLTSRMGTGGGNVPMVMEGTANFIDVEMEVAVRKYEVDTEKLVKVLRDHKGSMTNKSIAEALDCPITQVEHWFRTDSCFAVPDPDVWFKLKNLLGISTTEFDESIMTFEYKGGNYDMRNRIHIGDTAPTLTCGSGNTLHLLPGGPIICLQGNGIDRADTAGCNGKGWRDDKSYTLNTIDRPAVVYAVDQGGGKSNANVTEDKAPTLCTTHGGEPAVAYGLDRASFNQGQNAQFDFTITEESQPTLTARGPGAVAQPIYNASKASFFMRATENGPADTLVATDYKDPQLVSYAQSGTNCSKVSNTLVASMGNAPTGTTQDNLFVTEKRTTDSTHYIVRRLTPTECARLQGFADRHGDIEEKKDFTDEEYNFWLEVRKTYDAINGRAEKNYTKPQILTWYNKLHTDSAEYKMWGNGIALPTALYVLQGVADALSWAEFME